MAETREQQRTRILTAAPYTSPTDYDLALLFGYEPESWDGMWKLRAEWPIIRISRNWAIAAEVVTKTGDPRSEAKRTRRGRQRIRYRLVKAVH